MSKQTFRKNLNSRTTKMKAILPAGEGAQTSVVSSIDQIDPPSTPSIYVLYLDRFSDDYVCIEDTLDFGTICRNTVSAAYFAYTKDKIDIYLNKRELGNFKEYNNVILIYILDRFYKVKYNNSDIYYIIYTIDEKTDTLLDKLDSIRENNSINYNKQVIVDKNNIDPFYRGYYQIFTDKGKVRIEILKS